MSFLFEKIRGAFESSLKCRQRSPTRQASPDRNPSLGAVSWSTSSVTWSEFLRHIPGWSLGPPPSRPHRPADAEPERSLTFVFCVCFVLTRRDEGALPAPPTGTGVRAGTEGSLS